MIYIFDIDGTLADISHRLHFIQEKPADWRAFFAACPEDKPIAEVIEVAKALQPIHPIKLITGRSDEVEQETAQWINDQGIYFSDLLMRKSGDHREDSIVKAELLDSLLERFALSLQSPQYSRTANKLWICTAQKGFACSKLRTAIFSEGDIR